MGARKPLRWLAWVIVLCVVVPASPVWGGAGIPASPPSESRQECLPHEQYWQACTEDFAAPVCALLREYAERPPRFPEEEKVFLEAADGEYVIVEFKSLEYRDVFLAVWKFEIDYRWLAFKQDGAGGEDYVCAVGLFRVFVAAVCPYYPCVDVATEGEMIKWSGD